MRLSFLAALTLALATPALAEVPEPEGLVIVTLGGTAEANGAAPDPEKRGFFNYLELEYGTGIGLDLAILDTLPQQEITRTLFADEGAATYSGPLLADVLTMAGAQGKTSHPMALDGYEVEIAWDMVETQQPILATRIDGLPIALGQLGPTLIVFPEVEDEDLTEELNKLSVYALTYIGLD
ncbi:hypothetical protein [Pseudoruegeria sp. HB172150]|uniref:hypothetical protein n=1 Tax=Pseudoruegeria sp. HB172150 TaxID=2721164 RepID=UPI0015540328|nr:hypothetical protein [Pseudoruegeria sp. HB172150]